MLSHEKPFFVRPRSGSVAWGRTGSMSFTHGLCKHDMEGRASTRAAEFFARYAFPRETVETSKLDPGGIG